jgi:hypothetical protein
VSFAMWRSAASGATNSADIVSDRGWLFEVHLPAVASRGPADQVG